MTTPTKPNPIDCQVCCNTVPVKLTVMCLFCAYSACRKCVQTYLLSKFSDPHCMNCNHIWSPQFAWRELTRAFMTTAYKAHQENVLLEKAKALIPRAVDEVARGKAYCVKLEQMDAEIAQVADAITAITNVIRSDRDYQYEHYSPQHKVVTFLEKYMERASETIQFGRRTIALRCTAVRRGLDPESGPSAKRTKFVWTYRCPSAECRGLVGEDWKCAICDREMCAKCHVELPKIDNEKAPPHVCDPAILASTKTIQSATRPCPTCAVPILKSDGCDQMWCTQCQTAFDWKTGKIETVIHNPHYYEYLRTHGGIVPRAPGDVPCGGLGAPAPYVWADPALLEFHRSVVHYRDVVDRMRVDEDDFDLVRAYVKHEIEIDQWKKKLFQRMKKRTVDHAYREILTSYCALLTGEFMDAGDMNMAHNAKMVDLKARMTEIRNFTNCAIVQLNKLYGLKREIIAYNIFNF